jgi:integrase/recombinase XerD
LRRWFAWLVRERVLTQDPAHDLQLPRDERRLPRHPLSVTEVEAVLAQADLTTPHGLRNRAILEVLYSTGLRRDEALGLEFTDIDRERRTLLVRRGKGLKDRFVPIGARALAWLDKYLAEARPRLARRVQTPLVFVSQHGRRLHANQLSKIVRDYLRAAGIAKPGACHLFRHTTATLMLEAGADVRYIQALLGHTRLSTTQIYTHVSITKLREVHERTHPARLYRDPGSSVAGEPVAPPALPEPSTSVPETGPLNAATTLDKANTVNTVDDADDDRPWVPIA